MRRRFICAIFSTVPATSTSSSSAIVPCASCAAVLCSVLLCAAIQASNNSDDQMITGFLQTKKILVSCNPTWEPHATELSCPA